MAALEYDPPLSEGLKADTPVSKGTMRGWLQQADNAIEQEATARKDAVDQEGVSRKNAIEAGGVLPIENAQLTIAPSGAEVYIGTLANELGDVAVTNLTTINLQVPTTNTTGNVRLGVNGQTSVDIRRRNNTDIQAGDLIGGTNVLLQRRGDVWRLIGPAASEIKAEVDVEKARATAAEQVLVNALSASGVLQLVDATRTVAPNGVETYAADLAAELKGVSITNLATVIVRWPATNTGSQVKLNVNGRGAVDVRRRNNSEVRPGDLVNGTDIIFQNRDGAWRAIGVVQSEIDTVAGAAAEAAMLPYLRTQPAPQLMHQTVDALGVAARAIDLAGREYIAAMNGDVADRFYTIGQDLRSLRLRIAGMLTSIAAISSIGGMLTAEKVQLPALRRGMGASQNQFEAVDLGGRQFLALMDGDVADSIYGLKHDMKSLRQRVAKGSGGTSYAATVGYILVWGIGQSNMVGFGTGTTAHTIEAGRSYKWSQSAGVLQAMAEPTGNASGAKMSVGSAMAKAVLDASGGRIGVIFVNSAVGSTRIATDWGANGNSWTGAVSMLDAALSDIAAKKLNIVGSAVTFIQGENDANDGMSGGDYKNAFADLLSRVRTKLGGSRVPFIMSQIGVDNGATDPAPYAAIRQAQAEIVRSTEGTFMAASSAKYFGQRSMMIDRYHYTAAAYDELGAALGDSVFALGIGLRPAGLTE